jgi:hypothetical protein
MLLYFISSLSFVLLASVFTVWQLNESRKRESDTSGKVIDSLLMDKKDLLDRFFMSKGHLPTGLDVQKQAQERLGPSPDNGNKGQPRAGNPVDKARREAIEKEAEKLK